MNQADIQHLLEQVASGAVLPSEALEQLKTLPFRELSCANVDGHRALRTGRNEVIFAQGKTPEQTAEIAGALWEQNHAVMATRAKRAHFEAVLQVVPEAVYHAEAQVITAGKESSEAPGRVAVVTAGTSDIPAAEEACAVLEFQGHNTDRIYDVGVSGIHRLFEKLDRIRGADAVIVAAGMEGALASVIGGLTERPVIALPTGVGYGASFGGLAALLAMLNSCANGIAVVNIDNGYGAACLADKILRR
ncbi:MAG: nickel pincer cofactor biosynthesis protein LarB [Anaerovoracaceae bacterium]|nr:nickel pincer cofactor biosynthesis protein LarB [Bacillota bacterium]MDY3954132.1 nickel pincer cofactor biosynthesis protein LarB [Anaerovoracaceae bacterium]